MIFSKDGFKMNRLKSRRNLLLILVILALVIMKIFIAWFFVLPYVPGDSILIRLIIAIGEAPP